MKKRGLMMIAILLGLGLAVQVRAESNAINGLMLGAAVGTVLLGYVIVNEMDKGGPAPR